MNYIFYDLELNNIDRHQKRSTVKQGMGDYLKKCPQEIIEIGAVKTNENLKYIDTFRIFVKPKIFWRINNTVSKLTGITFDDIKYGYDFDLAICEFKKWIGEEYKLFTWGNDEIDFKRNLELHNLDTDWLCEHIDVQKYCMKVINFKNKKQISLLNALKKFNLELNKDGHRALNDALYTYQIFKDIYFNYDFNLLNVLVHNDKIVSKILNENKINKRVRCQKCGKFTKTIIEPFLKDKDYGIISYCEKCNAYFHKHKTLNFTEKGDIKISDDYELKRIYQKYYDDLINRHSC